MSQENVETVHRMYEAFNRQDFDVAVEFAHPDIAFVPPGDQPAYRGVESFRRWMEPDAFSEQALEPLEFRISGNKILVKQHSRARGSGSGLELEFVLWIVWTFDEAGLVTRIETYLEREEARARDAAGLSE